MAKVRLTGFQSPVEISKEKAQELMDVVDDEEVPNGYRVNIQGDLDVPKKDIGAIIIRQERSTDDEAESGKVSSMTTEELKKKLGDFPETYEKYKTEEYETYPGIGTFDTGIKKLLEKKGVITKKDGQWHLRPEKYRRYSFFKQMLEELWLRQEYAEEQEEKELEELAKQKEKVVDS